MSRRCGARQARLEGKMKSLDKLKSAVLDVRTFVSHALVTAYGIECKAPVSDAGIREALALAVDEIEGELARDYVELPKDAEGVTIKVGDILTDGEYTFIVHHIELRNDGCWSIYNASCYAWAACDVTHKEQDTWEYIVHDAEVLGRNWFGTDMGTDEHAKRIDEIIARCKALAGDE